MGSEASSDVKDHHFAWHLTLAWGLVVLLVGAIWWATGFLHFTVEFSGRFAFHEPRNIVAQAVTAPTTTVPEAEASRAGITMPPGAAVDDPAAKRGCKMQGDLVLCPAVEPSDLGAIVTTKGKAAKRPASATTTGVPVEAQ